MPTIAALVMLTAFIGLFTAVFHAPTPEDVPVALTSEQADDLGDAGAKVVDPVIVDDEGEARAAIEDGSALAAVVAADAGDQVVVSGAFGPATNNALAVALAGEDGPHAPPEVIGHTGEDATGLVMFYLVFGATLGGFIFGVTTVQTRGPGFGREMLLPVVVFGVLAGLVAGLLTTLVWDVYPSIVEVWFVASLLSTACAVATLAFVKLIGPPGVGLAALVLLVFGNAVSASTFPREFLPGWAAILSPWWPTGAAPEALRSMVWYSDAGLARPLLVLGVWILVFGFLAFRGPRARPAAAD